MTIVLVSVLSLSAGRQTRVFHQLFSFFQIPVFGRKRGRTGHLQGLF
jgi:hypothetical protein